MRIRFERGLKKTLLLAQKEKNPFFKKKKEKEKAVKVFDKLPEGVRGRRGKGK